MNRATEQPKTEQRLKGWVNATYRYHNGKKLGPYYFRRWKVGRRIHKEYIKPKDVETVKAQCLAYRERKGRLREGGKRANLYIDNWCYLGNMCNRMGKGIDLRPEDEAYIFRLHKEGMYITGRPLLRPPTKPSYYQQFSLDEILEGLRERMAEFENRPSPHPDFEFNKAFGVHYLPNSLVNSARSLAHQFRALRGAKDQESLTEIPPKGGSKWFRPPLRT